MADEIVVVYAWLDALAANAMACAGALADGSGLTSFEFTGNRKVTDAYHDFLGKWDENRGELHAGIEAVANAFTVSSEAFHETELELIASLEDGGGDGPSE